MLAVSSRLGPYEILAPLGAGGMGEVYRARDTRLGREVAVKVLPEAFAADPDWLARFAREARAVAALSHANILAIHDYGTHGAVTYAVMELLEGKTLRSWLAEGPRPWREAIEIGMAVAEGLAAAHAKGIVHQDVKPENLFLTSDRGLKILDFGLARVETTPPAGSETDLPTRSAPGIVMGTVGYMSPEQVRGQLVDGRSDIFSLGCVLYEMVSGRPPFRRDTAADTTAAILYDEPRPLADLGIQVSSGVESAIRRCLAKAAADRFLSARECASALRGLLSDSEESQPALPVRRPKQSQRQRRTPIDSLAVLPLGNTGGDANTEYLSDGITESIINILSRLLTLRVMARSTVFRYKGRDTDAQEVGRRLNVRAVLTGRVLEQGRRVHVRVELVDTADGAQLWGEHYDTEMTDLPAVEQTIAKEIAEQLRLRLTADQKKRLRSRATVSSEAYQLYLKGRYHWNKRTLEDFGKSIKHFQQAIEHDPAYALAYAGLAEVHATLGSWGANPPKTSFPVAKRFAAQAIVLEEGLAEAHSVLAYISMAFDWKWPEAEAGFQSAIHLNHGYATAHARYAYLLMILGRFEKALERMKRAEEFEPLSLSISANIGYILYFMGRYEQAIDQLRMTLAMDDSFPSAHHMLGLVYERQGRYDQAIEAFQKAVSLGKGVPNDIYSLGQAYAASGRVNEARKVHDELLRSLERGYLPASLVGFSHLNLGEHDQGFDWLEKAHDQRDFGLLYAGIDPRLAIVRSDPRFIALLRRMNLAS